MKILTALSGYSRTILPYYRLSSDSGTSNNILQGQPTRLGEYSNIMSPNQSSARYTFLHDDLQEWGQSQNSDTPEIFYGICEVNIEVTTDPISFRVSEGSSQQLASTVGQLVRTKAIQRVGELQDCAKEEQIAMSSASQRDLLKYISQYTLTDDLNIFLLDNGNFRIIWKYPDERQVGIEFLGEGKLRESIISLGAFDRFQALSRIREDVF